MRQVYSNDRIRLFHIREIDTMAQMQHVVASMIEKRLKYKDLIS